MRRRENRGEVTDTAPKLDAWAFIDDTRTPPHQVSLLADTWQARNALVPDLLPLGVGLQYAGRGEPVPIRPDRFVLEWADGRAVALDQAALVAHPRGKLALRHDRRGARVMRPLPPEWRTGRIGVRFYADTSVSLYRNDDVDMPAGTWFRDLLYFAVPASLDRWATPFTLRYVGDDAGAGAASVAFRIEPDSQEQRRAFRRARRAQRADGDARSEEDAAPSGDVE